MRKKRKSIKILTVCGSGVVSSSMISNKLVSMFDDLGYDVETVECNPSGMEPVCMSQSFDFIAYASPIFDNYGMPAIDAVGLLTGFGEDEFMEEALKVLKNAGK